VKIDKEFLLGIALGVCVPIVGYAIVLIIFEQMTDLGVMGELTSSFGVVKRMRTIAVLAIAFNLLPFNYFKKKSRMSSMRGVVTATFIYALSWIIYFWESIMQ